MTTKEYIENNIELIDQNNWEEFFKDAPKGIGGFLYDADMPFLNELSYIPAYANISYQSTPKAPSTQSNTVRLTPNIHRFPSFY